MSQMIPSKLTFCALCVSACMMQPLSYAQAPKPLQLTDTCNIVFASQADARKALATQDDFVQRMQGLERQLRLNSEDPVSETEYLQFLQEGAMEWKAEEQEQIEGVVKALQEAFESYAVPFPAEVVLVRVSKEVESNAPHCRGPHIILPDSYFQDPASMKKILAHELFHVLSSHNPELRDKLYGIIGFKPCNEIELPESLAKRRLTNPDAPIHQHVISVEKGEEPIFLAPVTLTRSAEYRPGGLFANLDFKLMVVEETGKDYQPRLREGKPVLLTPVAVPEFMEKIGRNTGYIIHPEETLADNFWMLVLGKRDVRDPWVLEKMQDILQK